MNTTSPTQTHPSHGAAASGDGEEARSARRSLQWWPSLAGAAFAAFVARDLFSGAEDGSDLAAIVAASGLVYLAAAALGRPGAAWAAFFVSVVVITLVRIAWPGVDPTWPLIALAAMLALYGLVRGVLRPTGGFPLQAAGMAAFGAIAVVAIRTDATVGASLVAAGLVLHAGWDAYHHATGKVVPRSMAEFCFVLDLLLAAAILYVTWRT